MTEVNTIKIHRAFVIGMESDSCMPRGTQYLQRRKYSSLLQFLHNKSSVSQVVRHVSRIPAHLTPMDVWSPAIGSKRGESHQVRDHHTYREPNRLVRALSPRSWNLLGLAVIPVAYWKFLVHRLIRSCSTPGTSQSLSLPKLFPMPSSTMELAQPIRLYGIILNLYTFTR